mmetsp:Transcript_18342/g.62398  ORF Transcript_18342/g.62398 Transcript_18342/m.62398 type:complete len:302 (+) Transcript_18342:790-1695(+)
MSSALLASMKFSSCFLLLQAVSTCGVCFACAAALRQVRSTAEKRLPSRGSCCMMSSLLKMGSRYIQERCSAIHSSSVSEASASCCSHSLMRSSKGFLKGEKLIACVITMWSSSCCVTDSSTRKTNVPVSRYSLAISFWSFHSVCILSRAVSMLYSLPATSHTLTMAVRCSGSPISMARARVKVSSGCTSMPMSAVILSQWRSRMPGLRMAEMRGQYFLKDSTSSRMMSQFFAQMGSSRRVKFLPILYMVLNAWDTSFSTCSALSELNSSDIQPFCHFFQLAAVTQNCEKGSNWSISCLMRE